MVFLFMYVTGLLGAGMHWLKRYARSQTELKFIEFWKFNQKEAILSFTTLTALVVTMVSIGQFSMDPKTLAISFLSGYSLNSAMVSHGVGEHK